MLQKVVSAKENRRLLGKSSKFLKQSTAAEKKMNGVMR